MGQSTRIVERLRLRADSTSAVQRAVPRLEDAFRTATLPDGGARLIVVRRLHLGRLPGGASAQILSLLLESRFTEADWRIVHAGHAAPDGGHAVWFRDALEAHELAALRVAAGRSVDAWFWPLAVPALAGQTSAGDTLRAIAFSLAARDEAPAALPAWTASLVLGGHREQLMAALRPGDGTALLRAAGVAAFAAPRRIEATRAIASHRADADRPTAPPARSGVESRGGSAVAASDDRREFVERMFGRAPGRPMAGPAFSSSARPQPSASTPSPSSVAERVSTKPDDVPDGTGRQPARRANAHLAIDVPGARRTRPDSATVDGRTRKPPARPQSSEPATDADEGDSRLARDTRPSAAHAHAPSSPWALPDTVPTAAGGVMFLVPTLERLGFGPWCASVDAHAPAPEAHARQIFRVLLSRLRVAEDDPAWRLAAGADEMSCASADDTSRMSLKSRIDELVPADARRRRSSARPRIHRSAVIPEIWLAACRRLLRRRARIGLATLVVRPARIACTATHVEVFFGRNAADLRIRRAGLDIDPGWVPWLRRVVTFRYGS